MLLSADNISKEEKLDKIPLTSIFANWHCLNMLASYDLERTVRTSAHCHLAARGWNAEWRLGIKWTKSANQKKKRGYMLCRWSAGSSPVSSRAASSPSAFTPPTNPGSLPTSSASASCWLPGALEKQSWKRLFHVFVGRRLLENRKSLRSSTCGGTSAPSQQPQFREPASGLRGRRRRRSGRWGGGRISHAVPLSHAEHWNRDGRCWRNHRGTTEEEPQRLSRCFPHQGGVAPWRATPPWWWLSCWSRR